MLSTLLVVASAALSTPDPVFPGEAGYRASLLDADNGQVVIRVQLGVSF